MSEDFEKLEPVLPGQANQEKEQMQPKAESGEVSSHAEAGRLTEKETGDPKGEILSVINQISYHPTEVLQDLQNKDVSWKDEQKFNRYLLEVFFGKIQVFKTKEFFEYVKDNRDEFRGLGVLPEGKTPNKFYWLIESAAGSKNSVAEVISVLKDTFSLTDDQTKEIVDGAYARNCDSYFVYDSDSVLDALKKEFPLDNEEDRTTIAKRYLLDKLALSIEGYNAEKINREHAFPHYHDAIQKKLHVASDLLNDQEVIAEGKKLLKTMLLHGGSRGAGAHLEEIPKIIQLYECAPSFFEGNFDVEIEGLWNGAFRSGVFSRVEGDYNHYDRKTLELLRIFGYGTEKTRTLFKRALITGLSGGYVTEGLIGKCVQDTEYSNLLSDEEIVQAARIGRKSALENYFGSYMNVGFKRISEIFNFSKDWTSNPEEVAMVKTATLKLIAKSERFTLLENIKKIQDMDSKAILISDEEIRSAVENHFFDGNKPAFYAGSNAWLQARNIFETWGLSLDRLEESAKAVIVDNLSKISSITGGNYSGEESKLFWEKDCIAVFPEVLDSSEVRDLVTNKILTWGYKSEPYGYYPLPETIANISRVVTLYKLAPELLEQWKINLAAKVLVGVYDHEKFKEFQNMLLYLKLSPDGLKILATNSFLAAVSSGDPDRAYFLQKEFPVQLKDTNEEKLQKAGEAGLLIALEQGNLSHVIKIQETCHLSPDFFAQSEQSEVSQKISQLLADQFLCRAEFNGLQEKLDLFGLSWEEAYPIMDTHGSKSEQLGSNLIKFIEYLGDENIKATFPQTFDRVRKNVFAQLSQYDIAEAFVRQLHHYDHLGHNVALELFKGRQFSAVLENIEKFNVKCDKNFALEIINFGYTGGLAENLFKFSNLDIDIADKLIADGNFVAVINNQNVFVEIKEADKLKFLRSYLHDTSNQSMGYDQDENYDDQPATRDNQDFQIDLFQHFFAEILKNRVECKKLLDDPAVSFTNRIWFSEQFSPPLDPILSDCADIFTLDLLTEEQYLALRALSEGTIVSELRQLGITKTGHEGIHQLREKMAEFRQNLTANVFNPEMIENPIVSGMFKSVVRFEDSHWGEHSTREFKQTVDTYNKVKDKVEPLPEYMTPSEVMRINTIDKKATLEWSEQFLSRYNQLIDSIESASQLIGKEKKPLTHIAKEAQTEVDKIITGLEAKLAQIPNEKAKIDIQQRINSIKAIQIRNVKEFQHNFRALSQFKELHPLLRKVTFAVSLLKNKQQKERIQNELLKSRETSSGKQEIKINEATTLLDFVDHITNKETMLEYFTDKKAKDAFLEINGVKAIQEELARVQNQDIAGTMPMQFVPVRNLLTEFSGHIADACWASKYRSILESFPNFTSVIFVKDPKGKYESLVGACFLIETESKDGEPLLVVRGLNPQENTINRLSVEDFFNKFANYVKNIATKDGRKVALVVDNHSGGSGTNRPLLFEYMKHLTTPLPLASNDDTNFNGYNITRDCVEIT